MEPWDDMQAIAEFAVLNKQMHAAEYSLEELMLRMWYVSGQNDPSIELVTP